MKSKKTMSISRIRDSWLQIFIESDYLIYPFSSLIPENDNSLLFINSGVAALKKYFRDPKSLPEKNLVNCQPVVRLSDITQVKTSSFHQTLFEMLGIFSIDGNFKKKTISLVWEWLVSEKWLNLPIERFFITVLREDKESFECWKSLGLTDSRILLGEKESNFWDMGDGPCGANTEIYFQFKTKKNFFPQKTSDLVDEFFVEVGNLVFPEFYHKENNVFVPLKNKCTDVGVGLERIAMIKQNKKNVFETDNWTKMLELINKLTKNENKRG